MNVAILTLFLEELRMTKLSWDGRKVFCYTSDGFEFCKEEFSFNSWNYKEWENIERELKGLRSFSFQLGGK